MAAGLAAGMTLLCLEGPGLHNVEANTEDGFSMTASSATDSEDWSKLRIDMTMGGGQTGATGENGNPLGNGLFAAKQNGGVTEDVFPLNHSTFWSGDPEYREYMWETGGEAGGSSAYGYGNSQEVRQEAYQKLVDTLKEAYTEGISQEERDTLMESVASTTQDLWESEAHSSFLSIGRMKMLFPELSEGITDYQRILDLDQATSEISFKKDGVAYQRETFISNPDNVMVTHITNENNDPMSMGLTLELPAEMLGKSKDNQVVFDAENAQIIMTGRAPYDFAATQWDENRGILMEARAKIVLPQGGEIAAGADGTTLEVTGAKEIMVLYTCETSYKDVNTDPSNSGIDYSQKAQDTISAASEKSYEDLKDAHLEEYRELFRRFWIDMDGENIISGNGTPITPYEYARYYQYGRYLNIACERENSILPHGLLGMWCSSWVGPNQGAFFMNENMEKMQAIKGAGNLADSSDGQYNIIKSWADENTGQKTAQETYGAEDGAWMISHSTGIWGKSGMWGGTVEYGSWLAGGIWALDSLYDKYEYTQDIELLKKYYPLMEGASKFALSTLIEVDGVNGELKGYKVVAPSGSPEHWYTVNGTKVAFDIASACDTLLYYNLFNMMEMGAEELDKAGISYDKELLERVLEARDQMIPLEMFIDEETGRFNEWYNEYPIGDWYHRHASHLLGLFLGHLDINEADTPELFYAMQAETLRWITANGGTHPDRSLMAMRAGYEDFAFANMTCGVVGTGYNHSAVMQWCAVSSSVAEAIVDSRFDEIHLMENMPEAWSSGEVKGIRARGGYQLSITWEDGELTSCIIDSPTGETPRVLYKGQPVVLSEDSRFTVNRADRSLEELKEEAAEKLEDKYTEETKEALQAAVESNDKEQISDALMDMEPIHFVTYDVQVISENGVRVLTDEDPTLQLYADSEKEDSEFVWSVESADGGNAEDIAVVDADGKVTAVGGGRVTVTAAVKGNLRSKASIELMVEMDTVQKEILDDRDDRLTYIGGWDTYNGSADYNGTETFSTENGAACELEFDGTGITFIGSKQNNVGKVKIYLDGEFQEEIDTYSSSSQKQAEIYSVTGLEKGPHTIRVETSGGNANCIVVDAFAIINDIPVTTERSDLLREYQKLCAVTENEKYDGAKWTAFAEARDGALETLNNFEADQAAIDAAEEALRTAKEELQILWPVTVNGGTGSGEYRKGEEVTVTAGTAPQGYQFESWSAEGVELTDASAETITFTMPENPVTITAETELINGVSIYPENGIRVLTEENDTLQLEAVCDVTDAQFEWSIEALDGGSADAVAAIDQNGKVTAAGGGKVRVTAVMKGDPDAVASIELMVEKGVAFEEEVDDRDNRIQYAGPGQWSTWNEDKHENGTITYVQNMDGIPEGYSATLEFEGDGIEFIGSDAAHIAPFKVTIDGTVVAESIAPGHTGSYGKVMYSNRELEPGTHTIVIEALPGKQQFDIDAFRIYGVHPAATDRQGLLDAYMEAAGITEKDDYTEASWALFASQMESARNVINDFDADQSAINSAKLALEEARENLKGLYELTVNGGTGSGIYAEGTSVTVKADPAGSGSRFKEWTAEGVALTDNTAEEITFIMPENPVKLTANYEKIVIPSTDAEIVSVFVKGVEGSITGTEIIVELPEESGAVTADDIEVTASHEKASVSTPVTADGGQTWSFSVTAEDGTTVKNYVLKVVRISDAEAQNRADVDAAKKAIEEKDWSVSMKKANDAEALETYIKDELSKMNLYGVNTEVRVNNVEAAVKGTDGRFSFTVSLSKGTGSDAVYDTLTLSDVRIKAVGSASSDQGSDSGASEEDAVPGTGDNMNMALIVAGLAVSTIAVTTAVMFRQKRRR